MAKKTNEKNDIKRGQKVVGDQLSFYASEAYKRLRTNISFCIAGDGHCRVIGVTSTMRGEGKSTTSVNLAYSLAQDGKRVLLIDGDMRLSTIADATQVNRYPGLSNLLAGYKLDSIFQKSPLCDNLYVISAGEAPPNPSELLGDGRFITMLNTIRARMDYIVIDLPPVSEVSDPLVVAPNVDGMILVVRRNYATKRGLNTVIRQLEQTNANLLGFVLTFDKGFESRFGKYGYGKYGKYGKSYGYQKSN